MFKSKLFTIFLLGLVLLTGTLLMFGTRHERLLPPVIHTSTTQISDTAKEGKVQQNSSPETERVYPADNSGAKSNVTFTFAY